MVASKLWIIQNFGKLYQIWCLKSIFIKLLWKACFSLSLSLKVFPAFPWRNDLVCWQVSDSTICCLILLQFIVQTLKNFQTSLPGFWMFFLLSQQWCTCFEWQWYLLHWWVWQDEWQHQSSSSWGHGKYFHNGNQLYFMWSNRKHSKPR